MNVRHWYYTNTTWFQIAEPKGRLGRHTDHWLPFYSFWWSLWLINMYSFYLILAVKAVIVQKKFFFPITFRYGPALLSRILKTKSHFFFFFYLEHSDMGLGLADRWNLESFGYSLSLVSRQRSLYKSVMSMWGGKKVAEPWFALFSHLWSPNCLLGYMSQIGQENLFLWVTNQKTALGQTNLKFGYSFDVSFLTLGRKNHLSKFLFCHLELGTITVFTS